MAVTSRVLGVAVYTNLGVFAVCFYCLYLVDIWMEYKGDDSFWS